ncbi:hypothetical protein SISNIDRAFT_469241 [Sistotremastrum niveocremeum HHB9708]|uniref:DUF6535 domain-containing protein n=1 Tax=Sistotremastrum niveocremeum HHB9708 TaxID=1314777 RepID=A0A164QA16_9AGAM|nr:hypothetical protein SISNIDRAFT_469241 [Sistotremastrum niveocremeum HHB9708]
MADQSSADSHAQPVKPSGSTTPTVSVGALETKFDKLLSLMETQTMAIREQTASIEKELKDHGDKLEILRKDAVKNDQPFEMRWLYDQQTWVGLNRQAVAMAKEAVSEWTTLMNVSLVFNAIFLAIVTAFIVPVLQGLQAPKADTTDTSGGQAASSGLLDAHRQEVIQQWIALFQVSAFALSIFNSALCVLGIQWGARLVTRVKARNYHESTIKFERRKAVGKKWLLRLSGLLFSTLLLSIVLFMIAFLLQTWVVAYAQPKPRPVLIAAAAIVTLMVFTILIIVTGTTYHAVRRDNSPFETPLSNVIRLLLQSDGNHDGGTHGTDDMLEVTKGDREEFRYHRGSEYYACTPETLKVFASVVINSPEAEALDTVVPSFRIGPWVAARPDLFPLFRAAYDRFMATDTSTRVRETLEEEFISFWRLLSNEERRENTRIGRWYMRGCRSLCYQSSPEAHAKHFRFFVEVVSAQEDNEDLREIPHLPYKECVGRVLASYDRNGKVGDRLDLFNTAIHGCILLLEAEHQDEVREIISTRHSSIIKSFMRSARDVRPAKDSIFSSFVLQERTEDILNEISGFLSDPLLVSHSSVADILVALVSLLPSSLALTSTLDLSHVFATVSRKGQPSWSNWDEFTDAALFLLDHGAIDMLSDVSSAYIYLRDFREHLDIASPTYERVNLFLEQHAERFSGASGSLELSDDARARLTADLSVFSRELGSFDDDTRVTKFVIALNRYYALLLGSRVPPLSRDDSLSILRSILRNPFANWRDVMPFMYRVGWSNDAIWSVISVLDNITDLNYVGDDLLPLRFLAYLQERDFILPTDADLSPLLACIARREPRNSDSWTDHSNTLMHYVDQGATFRCLTDRESACKFFELCANEPVNSVSDYRERTSPETRRRAIQYLMQMKSISEPTANITPSSLVMNYWYMTRATITKWLGHQPSVDRTTGDFLGPPVPHSAIEMEDLPPMEEVSTNPVTGTGARGQGPDRFSEE